MKYLLDANIFITAKNLHYGMDFVPAFWDWLDRSHAQVTVRSTTRVQQELAAGNDELADWTEPRGSFFYHQIRGSLAACNSLRPGQIRTNTLLQQCLNFSQLLTLNLSPSPTHTITLS